MTCRPTLSTLTAVPLPSPRARNLRWAWRRPVPVTNASDLWRVDADGRTEHAVGAFDTDGEILSILPHASSIYVAGGWTKIGGTSHGAVAALDRSTGASRAWDPAPDGAVRTTAIGPLG